MEFKPTKLKAIVSIIISIILSAILTIYSIFKHKCGFGEKVGVCPEWATELPLVMGLIFGLLIFILVYIIWSLIQKREKNLNKRGIVWKIVFSLIIFGSGLSIRRMITFMDESAWYRKGTNFLIANFLKDMFLPLFPPLIFYSILAFLVYGFLRAIRKEFLKSNFKKILLLLIPIGLVLTHLIQHNFYRAFLFPATFLLLNKLIIFSNNIMDFLFHFNYFFPYTLAPYLISLVLIYSFFIMVGYFILCLIVFVWDKIFEYFGERAKLYKRIVLIVLLVFFFIFAVLLPIIGSYAFINVEKSELPLTLSKEELFYRAKPPFEKPDVYTTEWDDAMNFPFQELTIRNDFIFDVEYKLPDVTICGYDVDGNVKPATYEVSYKYAEKKIDSKFYGGTPFTYVSDEDDFNRKVIYLKPGEEIKVKLKEYVGFSFNFDLTQAQIDRLPREVDELLFFTHVGFNNRKYCLNLQEKDLAKATHIIKLNSES